MPANDPIFLIAQIRLPLKKYPFFRENGYERGKRFGRGVGVVCVCVCGGGGGGGGMLSIADVSYLIMVVQSKHSALLICRGQFSSNSSRKVPIARA